MEMKLAHPPSSASPTLASPELRDTLEREILPKYLPTRRWFAGKARTVRRMSIAEWFPLPIAGEEFFLACIRVEYVEGADETYLLPLGVQAAAAFSPDSQPDLVTNLGVAVYDATVSERFRSELLRLMSTEDICPSADGASIAGVRGRRLNSVQASLPSRVLSVEQSNSSMIFGEEIFVKLYRKLEEGMNPDVEITRCLTERRGFTGAPPFLGALELRAPGREPRVLALAQQLVPNQGDAWSLTQREVASFYSRTAAPDLDPQRILLLPLLGPQPAETPLTALVGPFGTRARQLGARTAQMHLALAQETEDPDFTPEPSTRGDLEHLADANRAGLQKLAASLAKKQTEFQGRVADLAAQVLAAAPSLASQTATFVTDPIRILKTRTHGDYHLGQVLDTGADFMIIDFEGEPQRSLAERRRKHSPLRDVAGMLRSFHYAAHSALMSGESTPGRAAWGEHWSAYVCRQFLDGWLETAAGAGFLPSEETRRNLLQALLLEKAIYEVFYELNNRPAWVSIPLGGILQLAQATSESPGAEKLA